MDSHPRFYETGLDLANSTLIVGFTKQIGVFMETHTKNAYEKAK